MIAYQKKSPQGKIVEARFSREEAEALRDTLVYVCSQPGLNISLQINSRRIIDQLDNALAGRI